MVNRRIQLGPWGARVVQSVHNGFVFVTSHPVFFPSPDIDSVIMIDAFNFQVAVLGVSEFLWWWQLSKNGVMHNIMSIDREGVSEEVTLEHPLAFGHVNVRRNLHPYVRLNRLPPE